MSITVDRQPAGLVVACRNELPQRWLDLLGAALHSDDVIAAATAAGGPWGSHRPNPSCTLINPDVFDLLDGFDPDFPHPEAALADFVARARALGLRCAVVAELSLPSEPSCPPNELALLRERHPWLSAAQEGEAALDPGPLRRALVVARAARDGLSVTIDARSLGSGFGGTQTYVGGLVLALASASARLRVRAVLASDPEPELRDAFLRAGVELVSYEQAAAGELPLTDVVHRPQQVFTPSDLRLLELLGERLVVSHMDLIAYRAPTYHASVEQWRAYVRTTRAALAATDVALFFSEHSRRDALSEDLIPADRALVAGIGITANAAAVPASAPALVTGDRELLVMIGADYAHKNREFALELVDQLRERHGWDGLLVLAGPHVAHGSSGRVSASQRSDVLDLGPVSEAEKSWLAQNAVAHLAPSVYEGFGLAPLEAAAAGRPCIYAAVTSLREIIDPAAATIVPWDPAASADAAIALLRPGLERDEHLRLLSAALERHTWEHVVPRILDAYELAVSSPYRAAAPRAQAELEREQHIVELDKALHELSARVEDGLQLIDARDPLLSAAQRHGLMRVASRRWVRGPLLGFLSLLGIGHSDSDRPPADGKRPDAAP
jgi:glycosyltransferase involved in cell wall biosynthesis